MSRSRRFRVSQLCCLLLSLSFAGCSNSAQPSTDIIVSTSEQKRVASENVVTVQSPPTEIVAGASTDTVVRLKVDEGYHINANPAAFPYLIATQLDIPKAEGISAAGISYPPPLKKKFSFADDLLAVYEGEAELKVSLLADKGAKRGQTSIPAKLRIQACDDQVCYPPGTIDVWIPVTVK
jgi:DsbC/DsbD-like thiol-disulfide interchange protein